MLNLTAKKNEYPRNLSGGMKRKLCLGMALIGDPKVYAKKNIIQKH